MYKSHGTISRKFRGKKPRNIRGDKMSTPALAIDTGDYTALVQDCLREHFGESRSAVKLIAEAANCNLRTAENWYTGKNGPGGLHLLRLAAQVPSLQAEVRRLMAMEADLDPAFEQELHSLFRSYQDMVEKA